MTPQTLQSDRTESKLEELEFVLPIQTDESLKLFVESAFGVNIPDVQVCKNHTTPWRFFSDMFFHRVDVGVAKASRGLGGKSVILSTLGNTLAIAQAANVNILGGSGEQARRVVEHMQNIWNHPFAPKDLLASEVSRDIRFSTGNKITALMASQASVRGPHPEVLLGDEVDEMEFSILKSALGQPMSRIDKRTKEILVQSQVALCSTHHYADQTMTECIKMCGEKPGWKFYEWCYLESYAQGMGWLTEEMIREARSRMTEQTWLTEVVGQEPSPESRAINVEAVNKYFSAGDKSYEGREGDELIFEEPVPGGRYATGADWARKVDSTVIWTFRYDCNPMRLVAFQRCGREPWPVMIGKFEQRVRKYPSAAMHDGTGLGDVVDGMMKVDADAFIFAGRARADLISNYIAAIERGEIICPRIEYAEREHKYASVDDCYGNGHLPDSMSAGAMAYKAAVDAAPISVRWFGK